MQRTRDWRRKQWHKHNYRWPYVKWISKGESLYNIKYWHFRREEQLSGREAFDPDYNRNRFKEDTERLIDEY